MTTTVTITTKKLIRHFKNILTINHINLHITQNKIYNLLKTNKTNKTTTLRMLTKLLTPTKN